jgi:hypothetical protein
MEQELPLPVVNVGNFRKIPDNNNDGRPHDYLFMNRL